MPIDLRCARSSGGFLLVLVLLLVGCASSEPRLETPPELKPPQEEPGAPPAEVSTASDPEEDPLSVVIEGESDADESEGMTLLEAAFQERERRRAAAPPRIVITDENLGDHATGELTLVSSPASDGEASAPSSQAGEPAPSNESYWRGRMLDARVAWREAVDEVERLVSRVAELRQRFYAEDDPYYRDSQIKPAWDLAIERLGEARDLAEATRLAVSDALEEGRQAGALPGWLREGLELEPEVTRETEPRSVPEHQPQEPTVAEDDPLETP